MRTLITRRKVFVVGSMAAVGGAVLFMRKRRGHEQEHEQDVALT
jgi:hypothetical protein